MDAKLYQRLNESHERSNKAEAAAAKCEMVVSSTHRKIAMLTAAVALLYLAAGAYVASLWLVLR